jgi:hypothetical protein
VNKREQVLIDALKRLVDLNALEDSGEEGNIPSAREWKNAWANAVEALVATNAQKDSGEFYLWKQI